MFKIRKVKAFLTAPDGIDLLVVRWKRMNPGYMVGDAQPLLSAAWR